ncbi:MAG: dienelactone hydrolase family protein [Thermoanaerobaculia bacterium]
MSTLTSHLETTATRIPLGGGLWLDADVATPPDAKGVILFAHGSGSSRLSPRNRYVASELNFHKFATVLADLLTPEEEEIDDRSRALRFDIPMLTRRVVQLVDWVKTYDLMTTLPVGLFGASTGAAAALDAAAERPALVGAVVSRGGRPDLATNLEKVRAPSLLIVGGNDAAVLGMNNDALRRLTCKAELEVVPGATHLFEEPGTMEAVASLAGAWFTEHLS